jgi:hypothetical protein
MRKTSAMMNVALFGVQQTLMETKKEYFGKHPPFLSVLKTKNRGDFI